MRRFIYLDTDTLNSYIAQIYDGLVQTQETETQSSQSTDKQSEYTSDLGADADLKVFGKGIEGKMDFTYRHLKETSNTELISDVQTKLLHDNAFDQLINYLNKNEHLSNHNIGDFIEINDEFYIMDLDYYKKIFNDKKFLDFMKKSDRDKIQALLKIQQDIELEQENANSNEIKKIYTNLAKSKCAESDKGYDDTKDIIEMLCTLVPYRRTLSLIIFFIIDSMKRNLKVMLQQHYAPYSEKRMNMTINVLKDYGIEIQNFDSLDMLIEEAKQAQIQCDYIAPLKKPFKTLGAIIIPIVAFVAQKIGNAASQDEMITIALQVIVLVLLTFSLIFSLTPIIKDILYRDYNKYDDFIYDLRQIKLFYAKRNATYSNPI